MADGLNTYISHNNIGYKLYGDLINPNNFLINGSAADSVVYFEVLSEPEPRQIYGYTMSQYLEKVAGGRKDSPQTETVREADIEIHFSMEALELSVRITEEREEIQAQKDQAARLAAEYALPPLPSIDLGVIAAAEENAIYDKQDKMVVAAINLAGRPREEFDTLGIQQTAIDAARSYIDQITTQKRRTNLETTWYEVATASTDDALIIAATVQTVTSGQDAPADPISSLSDDVCILQKTISNRPITPENAVPDTPDSQFEIELPQPEEILFGWNCVYGHLLEMNANASPETKQPQKNIDAIMAKYIAKEMATHPECQDYKIALDIFANRHKSTPTQKDHTPSTPDASPFRSSFSCASDENLFGFYPTDFINDDASFQPTNMMVRGLNCN